MEIIPGKEDIHLVITLSLCNNILQPCPFYFFIGQQTEQLVNIINVEIKHHKLDKDIIGNILDAVLLERPQAMLLLESFYQIWLYLFFLHVELVDDAKLLIKFEITKQFGNYLSIMQLITRSMSHSVSSWCMGRQMTRSAIFVATGRFSFVALGRPR